MSYELTAAGSRWAYVGGTTKIRLFDRKFWNATEVWIDCCGVSNWVAYFGEEEIGRFPTRQFLEMTYEIREGDA